MAEKYSNVDATRHPNIARVIKTLAEHPNWPDFMDWFFAQCRKPDIDLTNPNPESAVAQSARMNLYTAIQNKLNEKTER